MNNSAQNILNKFSTFLRIIFLFTPVLLLAQENRFEQKKEKIEAQKIAFITQHLELSPEEAQVFWPVYNQFSDAIGEIQKQRIENSKKARKDIDALSEVEIEKMIDNHIILDQKELDIKKKYHAEFKKVLSNKKIAKLYHAEMMFKAELLRRMKEGEKHRKER